MTNISTFNTPRWLGLSANKLLFYGVVPIIIGIAFAGLSYPQLNSAQWPVPLVQIYSVVMVFFGWLIRDWTCAVAAHVWRKKGLPLIAVIIIGAALANIVIFPFNIMLQSAFEVLFIPVDLHVAQARWAPLLSLDASYLGNAVIDHILPALFLWTTTSLAFYHLLGLPRYGYPSSQLFNAIYRHAVEQHPEPTSPPSTSPRKHPSFMTLLPENRQREQVIAIKAEQHYVRIYTRLGEDLIHERFRSVVSDLEHCGGMQVHRSFAINPDFIQGIDTEDGQITITMVNDLRIPVSRTYTAIARRLKQTINLEPAPSH